MEVFISTDIETDGPIPSQNSMLSFGSAAFTSDGAMVGTFTRNLELLPGAVPDEDTMRWWSEPSQLEAWRNARTNLVAPEIAMRDYVEWVESLPGIERSKHGARSGSKNAVFVGYPTGFDFTFMYWHLMKFVGRSPFSFSALDIKSYTMAVLDLPYRETTKRNMPREWFPAAKHTHVALDDAIEQGQLFLNIIRASRSRAALVGRRESTVAARERAASTREAAVTAREAAVVEREATALARESGSKRTEH